MFLGLVVYHERQEKSFLVCICGHHNLLAMQLNRNKKGHKKCGGLLTKNVNHFKLMAFSSYKTSNVPPLKDEGQIVKLMVSWTGTGRYKDRNELGFGTPASRVAIVESAINRGAIIRSVHPNAVYELSDVGKAFVDRLHPKTFDPDLPFRLGVCIQNEDYDSMRRYINTVFGRQLRYQRNHF